MTRDYKIRGQWLAWADAIILENRGIISTASIAKLVGCSPNAIVGRASRLGCPMLPSPIRNRWPNGAPIAAAKPLADRAATLPSLAVPIPAFMTAAVTAVPIPPAFVDRAPVPVAAPPEPPVELAPVIPKPPPAPLAVHPGGELGPMAMSAYLRERSYSQCSWPLGIPGHPAFRYCDKAIEGQRASYCPDHCGDAFVTRPRVIDPAPLTFGVMRGEERI